MVVTYVMIILFVVGVIGAVASALAYDKPHGEIGSPMRVPRSSRRRTRGSRPSRQLQALEAALEKDTTTDQPASCSTVRSHGRPRGR
jgi:hypothetical protein